MNEDSPIRPDDIAELVARLLRYPNLQAFDAAIQHMNRASDVLNAARKYFIAARAYADEYALYRARIGGER